MCFFDVDDVWMIVQYCDCFREYVVVGMFGYVVEDYWQIVFVGYFDEVLVQVFLGGMYVIGCYYQCCIGVQFGGVMGQCDGFGCVGFFGVGDYCYVVGNVLYGKCQQLIEFGVFEYVCFVGGFGYDYCLCIVGDLVVEQMCKGIQVECIIVVEGCGQGIDVFVDV